MMATVVSVLILAGSAFGLIAAIGVVRMPDIYCRMHAATKAGAFGVTLMLLALALWHPSVRIVVQCALIIGFFYLTAPLAAQVLGRVAGMRNLAMWRRDEAGKELEGARR